jgi:N,N'-diacetylchitobiose transport system substrate-binding protein
MMTGGPGDNALIQDVNKEFATKHPDMKVDIQIQQWDNIVTKLTTALATSKPPDIVEMGNTQNPLQTFAGGLAELTDVKSSFEDSANMAERAGLALRERRQALRRAALRRDKGGHVPQGLLAAAGITSTPKTLSTQGEQP